MAPMNRNRASFPSSDHRWRQFQKTGHRSMPNCSCRKSMERHLCRCAVRSRVHPHLLRKFYFHFQFLTIGQWIPFHFIPLHSQFGLVMNPEDSPCPDNLLFRSNDIINLVVCCSFPQRRHPIICSVIGRIPSRQRKTSRGRTHFVRQQRTIIVRRL